jgi:DNA repair exonuclease SbcCD ATPase subunit
MPETQPSMNSDIRPVPDPTSLTTEANNRLEGTLRNLMQTEVMHLSELLSEKLAGVATSLREKIAGIVLRLDLLDARTAEQKQDTTNALNAALAAQKEAVAAQTASSEKSITKSETATIERIKAVETLLSASNKATDDKIDDLKNRIVAIEAVKLGSVEQIANSRASGGDMRGNMASIISVIVTVIAIISVIVTIFIATKH